MIPRRELFFGVIIIVLCSLAFFHTALQPPGQYPRLETAQIQVTTQKSHSKTFKVNPVTKVYELDGKPILWRYYHLDEVPLYLRLTIEAMQCRNPEFETVIVHESTIYDYLPDLEVPRDIFRLLQPNHQSDIFRVAILQRFGGVYGDVEIYALDKLYPLYELLTKYDIVMGDWGKFDVALAGMGPTRPNITFWEVWHRNQMEGIRKAFPHGARKTEIPWTYFVGDSEGGIPDEILTGRTKYLGFNGAVTENQLIEKSGLAHGSHHRWSAERGVILPLNWSPFLFVWGAKIRELYNNITRIDKLIPPRGRETVYSAFTSCALLDCLANFTKLREAGADATDLGRLNLNDMTEILKTIDTTICESIRSVARFDLDKYIVYHSFH